MMKFSEFIVLERTGGSVDPLGLLRPSTAIADNLFNQFTVLSNHPAYQGFLCFIYAYAAKQGIRPGKDFSRTFRDYEILWGVLNSRANISILNVTKYDTLTGDGGLTLERAQKMRDLYLRLNYGTLGHYSSPSSFWGLLNKSGTELTALGARLGDAWQRRGAVRFEQLLDSWCAGEATPSTGSFEKALELYHLDAEPTWEEVQVWHEVIAAYCARYKYAASLWTKPIPKETLDLLASEEAYPSFYAGLHEHYGDEPDLARRIGLAQKFELIAGCIQFFFEWEYARGCDEGRLFAEEFTVADFPFLAALPQRILAYLTVLDHKDSQHRLFQNVKDAQDPKAMGAAIIRVHTQHQSSKGAGAFLRSGEVLVRERVDLASLQELMQSLKANPDQWERSVAWHYQLDWYFQRAAKWRYYAKVAA